MGSPCEAGGRTVEFIYVGAHDLLSELTKPEHAGQTALLVRRLGPVTGRLKQRLADVVAKAGRRYSPEVHVEVEAVEALEGAGTDARPMSGRSRSRLLASGGPKRKLVRPEGR